VKLGSVATDVLGVSGRLMLNGLVTGKQSAVELADLAVGVLRKKRDQLVEALSGKVNDHHRLMLDKLLRALKAREAEIAEDETDIRSHIEPFRKAVQAWMQLPGIDEITAWVGSRDGPRHGPFCDGRRSCILVLRLSRQSRKRGEAVGRPHSQGQSVAAECDLRSGLGSISHEEILLPCTIRAYLCTARA
jgi:hypothetical protein